MTIAIMQATSQKDKNAILFNATKNALKKLGRSDEVVNFGIFKDESENFSYIETAFLVSLLLSSRAVDFVITGCSSGQGMMLALNSLPCVLCGYTPTPTDAYLFGKINGGNAVSLPLGLNFGWAGEINIEATLEKLFDGDFETGYPKEDAERKLRDTKLLKSINSLTKKDAIISYSLYDKKLLRKAFRRKIVIDYILTNGKDEKIIDFIKHFGK